MLKRVSIPAVSRRPQGRKPVAREVPSAVASQTDADSTPKRRSKKVPPTLALKTLDDLARRIRICVKCPLHESRTHAVPGEGKPTAKVMIVGEGPGKQEDQTGRPFVGNAGRYLEHVLEGTPFGREDFFITNIVKCRPPGNRTPKSDEMDTCTSLYLFKQIEIVDPKLILLLGGTAVKTLLGIKNVEEARGRIVEHQGRKYLASYHPAVRFYREDLAKKIKEDFTLLKRELLA